MVQVERKIVTLDDIQRRHVDNHREPYYAWIRQVVSLATGALTLLLGLQGHYVPLKPQIPFVLAVAWVALALTVIFGLIALRWSYQGPMSLAGNLMRARRDLGDEQVVEWVKNGRLSGVVPATHRWSVRLMTASFVIALIAMCAFSVVNLLR
ncbi:MAG: hypothetical protein Q7K57_57540 [Burkholderiaceae bacterium]|nr:hypothetical protein [Polaromonas sp.]MDO8778173.1 hypothetical protein [Burkholderiaceae bacterium]